MGPFIVQGLVLGSIYAVSVLGLVLTYNSSRVFNFSHGAIAYFAAVTYYWLTKFQGWSVAPAAIVVVLVIGPAGGLLLWRIVFRRLTDAPPVVRFVSTVGLWVAIPAAAKLLFGTTVVGGETLAPGFGGEPVGNFCETGGVCGLFDVAINWNQASVVIGAIVIAVGFGLLLRFTPFGLATRATVDSPRVAAVAGINPVVISAVSWMIGCGLAALSGVLLSPILGLGEIQFTLLLVVSFAAVVVGRLRSMPLAFAGAMLIGLLQGLADKYTNKWFLLADTNLEKVLKTGLKPSLPFLVMLAFLLAYQGLRREQFEVDLRAGPAEEEIAPVTKLTGWRAAVGPLAFAAFLFSAPLWLNNFWIGVVSQAVALGILFLTFTVVTGEGGMLSLAQVSLAGIGAFMAAKLATDSGLPVWLAIILGALTAVPVGMVVAALSLRLGGLYLALATLAFSQLVKFLVFEREDFSKFNAGVNIGRPDMFGIDFDSRVSFYILLVCLFCLVAMVVVNLRRSTTGLVLTAVRSSEAAAATIGVSIVRTKIIVFGLSAFIAGLGGALYGSTIGVVTVNQWDVLVGIVWLAIVVTWGIRSVIGALMAAVLYVVVSPPTNKLSFIFVIIVVFVMMGMTARLVGSKMIYTQKGMVLVGLLYAGGITAIYFLLGIDVKEEIDLGSAWDYIPTIMFGLGAVFLAKQPRGVLFDVNNRIRLRNLRREARLAEAAAAGEASA
jgi:branched-chain amino acid transport system permease protein